jgi:hypothetical protein
MAGCELQFMKSLKFQFLATTLLLALAVSCSQEEIVSSDVSQKDFLKSVAIVQTNSTINAKGGNGSTVALTIELFNFNKSYVLQSQYIIEDVEYYDNGQSNDLVAGDGIYTSVKSFERSQLSNQSQLKIATSEMFKYSDQLSNIIKKKYKSGARTQGVGVTCKVDLRPCSGWWSWCGCDCVYIHDCELEVSIP